jgi:outer membrane protein assembly factor BamE (lipoprotein component of BamABCDE complex)
MEFVDKRLLRGNVMKSCLNLILFSALLCSCSSASQHASSLHAARERSLTAGIVQKQIRNGMSGADVASALGSPNIVTKDDRGFETWVYDKIATEASYSNSEGGVGGLGGIIGAPASVLLLGLGSGDYRSNAGASALTQKTLTVVIKFDQYGKVDSSSYHSSNF